MSTQEVTTLLDLIHGLLGKQKLSAEVVLYENGEQIKCNHGVANQEEIAQMNLEKWNDHVNPFPRKINDASDSAVSFAFSFTS